MTDRFSNFAMSALTLSSAKSFSRRPMPEQTNHAGKNFDEAKGVSAPFWEGTALLLAPAPDSTIGISRPRTSLREMG
jgi:hypothetical protein